VARDPAAGVGGGHPGLAAERWNERVIEIRRPDALGAEAQLDEVYGIIAKNVIEAHHLVAVSKLGGKKLSLDPKLDFAVLCPNCHRVIHRSAQPENVLALRKLLQTPV